MTKRRITCLCLAVLLLLPMLLTGCGEEEEKVLGTYTANKGIICETKTVKMAGSKYELTWVKEHARFVLKDTESGDEYYSTPEWGESHEMCAPLMVEYINADDQLQPAVDGRSGCIDYYYDKNPEDKTKAYSVEVIDNGFRATYSFPKEKFAVAVEYILTTDGMVVRIPMDRLQESENRIYAIHLAPYFASAVNDVEDGDSYLFVPSGGGAVIEAKRSSKVKEYYESVYGDDQSEPITMQTRVQSQIYLPVFGATTINERQDDLGDDSYASQSVGLMGIIEEGADCAMVYAKTGGEIMTIENKYSCVYTSFVIRSKEKVVYNAHGTTSSVGIRYSDQVTSAKNLSVRYIPLSEASGDDTSYVGMAKRYREYLQGKGYLKNTVQDAPALSINLLGGTQITESLFGVPYQTDVATTTLAQAQKIVSELKALVGNDSMLVTLEGFGEGGLAHTEIGGGFDLSSEVGKQSDLDALLSFTKKNNIVLSMNYELAQFQGGGSGVSVNSDTAECLSTLKAKVRTYQMNTGLENESGLSWYLLTRSQMAPMMAEAIAAAKENKLGAISIGSYGHIQYSDFRDEGYAAMAGFSDAVSDMLKQGSNSGLKMVVSDANAYAALNADYVTEVPMHSSRFSMLSYDVPFYNLVFQGYKVLTSSSINLAVNVEKAYLQAVSTGMGLQFTLCNDLHDSIKFDEDTAFVSSRYADWKDRIAEMSKDSSALLAKIGNQPIKNYTVDGDLTITEFANGVKVYVNYSNEAMTVNGIEIPAMDFVEG